MSQGVRSSSRERTMTEKGQAHQLDLDRGEGLRLYKEWNKLLERAKDILLRSNDLSLLTNVKEALLSVEVEVSRFTQSHDVDLGSQVAEIPSEHAEVITLVENRISALQAASSISTINKSTHSDRPRESAILEEAQLSEVDSKFLVVETNLEEELKKIENKLRQLKLDKLIERGKVISHVRRESLLNPDADPFAPLPEPDRHQLPVDHISGGPLISSHNQYIGSHNNPMVQQVLLSRMPMPTPVPFEGDCLQFPAWKNSFDTLIVQSGMPPSERLYYLAKCLKGDPYDCIQGFFILSSETAYYEAMNQLVHRYGNKYVIASAFRRKLYDWPKIGASDSMGLRKLSDFANQCLSAKRIYDSLNILDDETEHLKVLAKLPESLVARWARKVHEFKNRGLSFSLFASFVEFLFVESELACDPIMSVGAVKSLSNKGHPSANNPYNQLNSGKATVHSTQSKEVFCVHCKLKGHYLIDCTKFTQLTYTDRFTAIKTEGLCFGCLRRGHSSRYCRTRLKCNSCGGRHPTLLHDPAKLQDRKNNSQSVANSQSVSSSIDNSPVQNPVSQSVDQVEAGCYYVDRNKGDQCSMIIPVFVSHKSCPGREILVYCLLDNQSDTSFILSSVSNSLGVKGHSVKLSLSTMAGKGQVVNSSVLDGLVVRGYDNVSMKNRVTLPRTYSRDIMPANRNHIPTRHKVRNIPNLEWLDNILSDELDIPIGLLIGYNCAQALKPKAVVPSLQDGLFAQQSILGWGVIGFVNTPTSNGDAFGFSHNYSNYPVKSLETSQVDHHSSVCFRTSIKEVFSTVDCGNLLEQDFSNIKVDTPYSVDDTRFLSILSKNIRQQDDGHYVLPLPFKNVDMPILPCNSRVALNRLGKLKNRFIKDPQYYTDYCKVMDKLLVQGHASLVNSASLGKVGQSWFLPHHGVYQAKKPEKLRVVFDGSARYQGVSLNENLLAGPDLINSLTGILCRFRQELVAFSCDIQEMFHQFVVDEPFRSYLQFYWYKDNDLNQDPSIYVMNRHLFGSTSSPGCSNFCLKQLASDYETSSNRESCKFVKHSFYVDDGLLSVSSSEQAISVIKETVALCEKGGLKLHKFVSNCPLVRREVDAKAEDLRISFIERTLGVVWCIESDTLQFRIVIEDKPFTRRGVLSIISSIFDPLGLVSPYLLDGKKLLQEVCSSGASWDEPIPDSLLCRWRRWLTLIVNLNNLTIPRCYKSSSLSEIVSVEMHHFSDGSFKAYGQCSYIRLVDVEGNIWCSLLMGKSRVSPLKSTTVPRLELTAALLSLRVSLFLKKELEYENVQHFYWSDSAVTLAYIRSRSKRFHVYVANRVQEIRENSDTSAWYYVPTRENPSDDASRGLDLNHVTSDNRWFQGPSFLWKKSIPTFESTSHVDLSVDDPEVKCNVFTTRSKSSEMLDRLNRFSSWTSVRRAVALCIRFVSILRRKSKVVEYIPCTVDELRKAEFVIVKLIQSYHFDEELISLTDKSAVSGTSKLANLCPFLDDSQCIRVGGRLSNSDLSDDVKHPLVLPKSKECHLSKLLVKFYHCQIHHQGRSATVNRIRDSGYWIMSCIASVSSIIHFCVVCRKLYRVPDHQKMSDLPSDRCTVAAPFTYCAVDMFGPYYVKEGRKLLKRYGVIFVCMSSKGLHIEVANSLSTDSFLNAFRRLISVRGPVRTLRSDCGTNFTGAERELKAELELLEHDKIRAQLSSHYSCDYTVFKFNKPYASHTGGIWERQIRSIRRVMSSLLGSLGSQLDDESLRTFLSEAAGIINSRPLSVDSLADANSVKPITPNSLLTMKTSVVVPPIGNFESDQVYAKRRWRVVQYLAEQFWYRWRKEYIHNLQVRSKWCKPKRNFAVGDIVYLTDDLLPRCDWRVCRVQEVYPGSDGIVRSIKLVVGNKNLNAKGVPVSSQSVLCRSVHKVILLLGAD